MQTKTSLRQESPENATARARVCSLQVAAISPYAHDRFAAAFAGCQNVRLQRRGFPEAMRRMQDGLVEDCGSWRPPKNPTVESPAHFLSWRCRKTRLR